MGEQRRETVSNDGMDDFFDPMLVELGDEMLDDVDEVDTRSDKMRLAEKRRRAEQRLEALRLREELGDYDFDFDDDF